MCLPTSEEQQLGANTESLLRSIRGPLPGKSKQGSLGPSARGSVEDTEPEGGLLSDLREVQCLICCLLHQMFIADPNIAKLVHFQVTQWEKIKWAVHLIYVVLLWQWESRKLYWVSNHKKGRALQQCWRQDQQVLVCVLDPLLLIALFWKPTSSWSSSMMRLSCLLSNKDIRKYCYHADMLSVSNNNNLYL